MAPLVSGLEAPKQLKHLTPGMEKAHSWSVDGHKTLNTPYDSGILLCRDKEALVSALQATGAYLTSSYSESRDGMLYTPEMSRRARAIELWAALKYLGRDGVDELVVGMHQRAQQFADLLKSADFDILNDVVFNQVIVSPSADDQTTQSILEAIQQSGECWVGGSLWNGQKVIRISVCSWVTTQRKILSRSAQAFIKARDSSYRGLLKNNHIGPNNRWVHCPTAGQDIQRSAAEKETDMGRVGFIVPVSKFIRISHQLGHQPQITARLKQSPQSSAAQSMGWRDAQSLRWR